MSYLNFNFSFDADFEFDNKDEMSSLKKRVKTDEEINKCSTSEEFTLVQKAIYIMKKGYEVQKKSVVSHLHHYLREPGANDELLPLILNSIEAWDVEFQCLLAQALCHAADEDLKIEPPNLKKAISLSLEFIDNLNVEDLYLSWRDTFPKLVFLLNFIKEDEAHTNKQLPVLTELVYPKIAEMTELKQERTRRIRGCELMRDLIKTQGGVVLSSSVHLKQFRFLS